MTRDPQHHFQPDPESRDYCMCGLHRDNSAHDQMSAYAVMKAQKDELLQREREALERPLLAEIDSLRHENKQLREDLRNALSTTMIQNLNSKIVTLEADRDRLLLACKAAYKLPRPWMVAGNISWPEWDSVCAQIETAVAKATGEKGQAPQ